jgi:fatty acid omega-hydroxylase
MWTTFMKHAQLLADAIDQSATHGKVVDMFALFNRFTLDSIGEVGFGHNIGSLQNPDNPVLRSFDAAQIYAAQRFNIRSLSWKLHRLLGHPAERAYSRHCKALDEYARSIAREAWRLHVTGSAGSSRSRTHQGDFLSLFIHEMRGAESSTELSPQDEEYLRDVVMNFLIAGRDTTAQALSWIFFLLGQHPEVEQKLRSELDKAVSSGEPTFDAVMQLEFAQCVVNEALRLYPSVPKNIKVALNRDVLPDGTVVPAGCQIAHIPFMMGRMQSIWGDDARQFRPERWLGKEHTSLRLAACA